MNINILKHNDKFRRGDYVRVMNTTTAEELGVAGMVGLLDSSPIKDEYGDDVYDVKFRFSNLPEVTHRISTSAFNPIDVKEIVWGFNTGIYFEEYKRRNKL